MCCGQGAACGLTDEQIRDATRVLAEVFGSPRARYAASESATMLRESREAAAYWGEVFDCGQAVLGRGGSADELLACRTDE